MRLQANSYENSRMSGDAGGRPFHWGNPHPNLALSPSKQGGGGVCRRLSSERPLYDNNSWDSKEGSPMQQWRRSEEDYLFERRPPRPEPPPQPQRMRSTSPFGGGGGGDEEFENPIMAQAKAMLSKVMACRTPDDPMNAEIVRGKKHMICNSRVITFRSYL